ncbi:MAG: DNA polymerase III subunit delta [Ignavibacteriae bacterium]|nr:DNA polymerase III subunit delta [Ignavibacteriota bacterium]
MAKDATTYEDLQASLARKSFSPVYLFFGEENFLIEEATHAVLDAALTPDERGFNLDLVYGNEADARDIVSHASSFPMMSERRVVIVRDADKLGQLEILASYCEEPLASTCLILACTKPDFRRKPFSTIKKTGCVIEFKPLWENQIGGWISRRVKKDKREIAADAVTMLAAYVGTSLREIANELEKLYIFLGEKKSITVDDVSAVVGVSKEFTVFELQWALGARQAQRATEILEHMLDQGEQPIMMVAVLTKFFVTLMKLQDAKRRGVSGNQQLVQAGVFSFGDKYLQAANRFSQRELENIFLSLSEVDEKLKSTSTDPRLLMQTFVVNATRNSEPAYV